MSDIRAGAGRARIVLPFPETPSSPDGGHDPLRVRVLVLDDGAAPLTVAVVDRSIPPEAHPGIERVLAHITHVDPGRVLLCVGHAATPDARLVVSEALQHAVEDAVAWAAFAARSTCRPARVCPDRVEDAEGRPIALLMANEGTITADALEHSHHDQFVALFLTAAVSSRVAGLLADPHRLGG